MGGEETGAERTATVSGEALTARELELLRDLPSLLSLEEIADAHVLSVNTVKTHLKAIYRKFEVGSRRQAVDRARELGLL
nr:LuxR C-terminal-related transcriptional regulator [Jiangella mangrovi]